ncbi:MAG: terpene cyclase/mutase family protein [Pirellulales bacterium]|jgi:squalene-hopene/tetraprenyl-beta-curcumene cyclase|nr:terpene cyclase/mutase family protein [Thermoguttaceae bacterium]MDD4786487.1 terpene cyclase/mutase family protein [Pirellulales bacterium]MDI9444568.1 terpene cyclase/mutase family protein [Planctomycetota bacterium]NLZ03083.1 terpene cyclase/mutase family protein [Pirellulaceae bacterium]
MNHFRIQPCPATDGRAGLLASPAAETPSDRLAASIRRSILLARHWLLREQRPEGHWVAELEGDSILQSETILLLAFFGRETSDLARRAAERLLATQLPGGGWSMYPGGGVEISGSVKAYFALKLTGHDPSAEYMQRARRAILAHGGADAVNSYTRFYLAILGQIPFEECPEVPPEIIFLPKWFPINLYAVSAWSRTMIVPLSIVSALRPTKRIDAGRGIRELFIASPQDWPELRCPGRTAGRGRFGWDRFFRAVDATFKFLRKRNWLPLRKRAIQAAERWTLQRTERSDGLGAIYPPIVWSLLAFHALGYGDDSPEVQECWKQLGDLVVDDEQGCRIQPCKSPVWDTAIALRALSATGLERSHPAAARAVDWLLDRQVDRPGDWSETVQAEPGGWCFEYNNDYYPDCDDTAMVLMALQDQFTEAAPTAGALPPQLRLVGEPEGGNSHQWLYHHAPASREDAYRGLKTMDETAAAIDRGLRWLLAMQNRDGGWGAFDRNNNRQFLCRVPFADHNAMIDPSTPDLSGRVLEALGKLGLGAEHPAVSRCVAYLRAAQEADGSWFGRWGVNYVYGTWQVITGLVAVGVPADDPAIAAGANWLLAHQQPSGGWGESPETYADPTLRGQGPVTASQTAWAVLGLLAAGMEAHPAVGRGIRFLVEHQGPDGKWDEPEFTGTGFPQVFYLRYHYYPLYFPLLALSRFAVSAAMGIAGAAAPAARRGNRDGQSATVRAAAAG